jgi:4-hydroxybenzoyl-CoA reductase subunit beta
MRLPCFKYHAPRTIAEAATVLAGAGPGAMLLAGGTDLLPNMKRRHQVPGTLIGLRNVTELKKIENSRGVTLGAGLTLTEVVREPRIREAYTGLWQAAVQVATPHLRNTGTLGGNLCLDTRCNYYNQTYEWRKAINFCMKKDGDICWVAPSSPRCWAVQSSDTAPVAVALGAELVLAGPDDSRTVPAAQFFNDDGIRYLNKLPDEILTEVRLPPANGWDATYWKLRRRGSFDFPVLGVAVWIKWDGRLVADARIVLGAVASYPVSVGDAAQAIIGTALEDEAIAAAAQAAFRPSKPMDNTDFGLAWRKEMTRNYVRGALEELRACRGTAGA